MLRIDNLHVGTPEKEILKGLTLHVGPGEVHAIMGPNGSGKSTLGNVLAGRPGYDVTDGTVTFLGQDLLAQAPEERAASGVFLAFQYPVEIPGVGNQYFLKTAVNAARVRRGEKPLDAFEFIKLLKEKMALLEMGDAYKTREVNVGFSGGEKKRNEILQLLMLDSKLAVLDETDSGLDIDALRVVSRGINGLRDGKRSFIVVTHYQRLLDEIQPDVVHVLVDGRIVRSGPKELALELEDTGYADIRAQAPQAQL